MYTPIISNYLQFNPPIEIRDNRIDINKNRIYSTVSMLRINTWFTRATSLPVTPVVDLASNPGS